ncbi:hypothetical protein MLD52_23335, partial [Puniceicoccaceae bacterium K14]|nr:hypothetical protein [Puniceicoccaceae bacterium K14]
VNAGEYEIGLDPTSGDIDFNAGVADLGSFAFYQDSNSGGSLIIDNLRFSEIGFEAVPDVVELNAYLFYDYENGDVGGDNNSFTPEQETNLIVLDDTTDPASPLEGNSLYILDSSIDGVDGVTSDTDDNVRY